MSEKVFAKREFEEGPSQRQIQNFGRECVLFAHRHDRLRRSTRKQQFSVGPMSHFRAANVWDGEPFGSIYKDTYAVFASMSEGNIDSMKIIHGLVVEDMGSNGGTFRQVYTFDSIADSVNALRKHSFGSSSYTKLEDLNLDNVSIPTDIAEQLALEQEFATVSEGDFSMLSADMKKIMGSVDRGELVFSEQRANHYADYYTE